MSEDDTELRDVVAQTLETNGVLGNIRAQLRACVFLALEDNDSKNNKLPFQNQDLKEFLNTRNGKLVFSLIKQTLHHFNLEHTLSVLQPEAGLTEHLLDSDQIIQTLGLPSKSSKSHPLLSDVIEKMSKTSVLSASASTNGDRSSFIPKDLTPTQIEDARRKFRQYDKDRNGLIDKEELRRLFIDLFPSFNSNMIDRYVNDEFRASDKDFSNGIDFDEFVGMYRRLFIQCRGVVAGTVEDLVSSCNNSHSSEANLSPKHTSMNNSNAKTSSVLPPDRKHRKPTAADLPTKAKTSQLGSVGSGGSSMDEDSFFDDPLPSDKSNSASNVVVTKKLTTKTEKVTSNGAISNSKSKSEEDTGGMTSLKGMPTLFGSKNNSVDKKNISHKLSDLGLDDAESLDYQDDFDDPSLKTLSARSDKPKKTPPDNDDEIDELIEVDDDVLQSGMDDLTVDSDRSLGVDYIEEAKR